ncbi:MAG: nucleotidyltransferase family protein [Verrucomicrobiota bacterium]
MNAAVPNSLLCGGGAASALMILAAGASARLRQPKQLLPFRGRSLLRHAAETALASVCRPVVVVLGAYAERLHGELSGLPVTVAMNPQWTEGMSSSIRAGLKALAPGSAGPNAVIIMLCDQPLISAQFLDRLVAVHQSSGKGIVAAAYGGEGGAPALFSRAYYPELAALRGSRGAKAVIVRHAKDAERIALPEAGMDVDRREDLPRLGRLAGASVFEAGENGHGG